jgi:spore maturation protein CgeB
MVSSWPPIVEHFRSQGIAAEHFRLGFDRRVLDRLTPRGPKIAVSFVGGFAPSHPDRIAWLEEVLQTVDAEIYCYGIENAGAASAVRRHYRGPAWGLEMYAILARSQVTLNRHAQIDVRGAVSTEWANNMRLYEATGVGACVLTEWRPRLHELFEPDHEVATYRDTAECVEKIRFLLVDDARRSVIARRGQQRTLLEHTYEQRMAELIGILSRYGMPR